MRKLSTPHPCGLGSVLCFWALQMPLRTVQPQPTIIPLSLSNILGGGFARAAIYNAGL